MIVLFLLLVGCYTFFWLCDSEGFKEPDVLEDAVESNGE